MPSGSAIGVALVLRHLWRKKMHKVWAATAMALGVWETAAVATKKVPTITRTCHTARGRWNRKADVVIAAWLFGLAAHLFGRG
jgi:hypothetical protein